jgi:PAS domain S-box-containing protein
MSADTTKGISTATQKPVDAQALDALEHNLGLRPDSTFLAPKWVIGNLELTDIIDVQMIQPLMEYFYDLVHIPMAIIDLKGKLLVAVGWQEICTKFHRVSAQSCKNCVESDTQLTAGIPAGEFRLYKCKNNMWDVATPIVVDDWHFGNLWSGQFFFDDEPLDCDLFRAQAKQYGFKEEDYLAAVRAVPRLSRKAVNTGMAFLMKLANMLSHMGYNNLKLARSLAERERENSERRLAEQVLAGARLRIETQIYEAVFCLLRFAGDHSLEELLRQTLDEVCALTGSKVGFYHFVSEDQQSLSLQAWSTVTLRDYCKAEGRGLHYPVENAGVWADCVRERRAVIHNDYPSLPHRKGLPPGHAEVVRELVVPVFKRDQIVAILGVGNKISDYNQQDVETVTHFAELAWVIAEHKRAEEALRESEERHRTILLTTMDGFWLVDMEGRLLQVNEAYCGMSGYTAEELLAMRIADLDANETSNGATEIQKVLAQGDGRFESRHRRKDGGTFYVEASVKCLSNDGGRSVWFFRDITERRRSEAELARHRQHLEELVRERTSQLEAVNAQLQAQATERKRAEAALIRSEKLASVGRIAATMAHEINNPLEAVTNCVYLAKTNPSLPPELKEHLEVAERALYRVAHIAKRTLGFYKEHSKPTVVDVPALVEEVLALYDPKFTRADIRFGIDHDGNCAGTLAIAGEIRQVISNLVKNAIDASQPKGMVRVRTSRVTLNGCGYTRVTVADAGAGISKANLKRIFEPFFTTKEDVGTGLGLWVSSEIVQKHRGRIRLRSVEGKGSVFSVFLPNPA